VRGRRKLTVLMLVLSLVLSISSCAKSLNHAPSIKNPSPANNATDVSINTTLTWEAEDEDGDALTFDVYFGTSSNPPLVESGISKKEYTPETLEYGTTYYWKVVAKDEKGGTAESPVWKFTTMSVPDYPPRIIWQKALGGSSSEEAYSIQQTRDGGYIVAGYTKSNDGDVSGNHGWKDAWIVKLDKDGNIQWQKVFGGSNEDFALSIQQTGDEGYIVAGYTKSNDGDVTVNHGGEDAWIVKLDKDGNIQWQKVLGGSSSEEAYSIQQTRDGGYIVSGYTKSNDGDISGNHGGRDAWIAKLDRDGNIQWRKILGGSDYEEANSIQQTRDGGYIVAGYTWSNDGDVTGNHGRGDAWIVKLDRDGNIQWQKALGGSDDDWANSIQQTSDGGYIVAGWTYSDDGNVSGNHGYIDAWIVKLDKDGNIQWQKVLGGSNGEIANSIQQTKDGGYIVAGYTGSNDGDVSGNHGGGDTWLVKLDGNGNIEWQKALGGSDYDIAYSIRQTSDGGYIVAGWTESNDGYVSGNHGEGDVWIVKLGW